jgi:hypothetical protein
VKCVPRRIRLMTIQRALALAALTLASATIARATITYSSQSTLEASLPALTFQTVNFTGLVCAPCSSITDPGTGLTFTTSSPVMSITNATTIHMSATGTAIQITGLGSALAFGVNIPTITFVEVDFNGDGAAFSSSFVSPAYFGARVSSAPITGLAFTQVTSQSLELAGFEVGFGSAAPEVPETGTLLSLAAGLLLIGSIKRRRRRRAS